MEASTAFSMGGVPDPIFSRPNITEKIAVWLRETTPTRAMVGNTWGFEFCKVQMHQVLGMPVGQIPTFTPLKNRGKYGEFDRQCF